MAGAQAPATFLNALETAWKEFEIEKSVTVLEGETCPPEGC